MKFQRLEGEKRKDPDLGEIQAMGENQFSANIFKENIIALDNT